MATGAAELSALARQIEQVPATAVDELARWFVPRSEEVGGRMLWYGRVVQLSAKVVSRRSREGAAAITIVGTPVAAWSIKSYGRRGGYDVYPRNKEALKLAGRANVFFSHVTIHRPVSGDHRWDRLVDEAGDQLVSIATAAVEQVVR